MTTHQQQTSSQDQKNPQVFPEPTVGALISNSEGKILLCKSPKWFDNYTLPGGHVELGETMVEAVKREVMEEVGLDVEVEQMLTMHEAIYAKEFYKKRHFIFIDFACRAKSDQVKLDQTEILDYVWVYPGAAYNLKLDSFTRKTIDAFMNRSGRSSLTPL